MEQVKSIRREVRNLVGRTRGGRLAPVMCHPFLGGEGGTLSQSVMVELDPMAGRLVTPVTVEMVAVYVPVQAIDYIKNPSAQYAGMTEVVRQKLLTGTPLFVLEAPGEISNRMGVVPRKISNAHRVNEAARLAHNAAVNHLRKRRYAYAVEVLHGNTAVTPAIVSETVLDRLQGVLDPENRVNGSVQLNIPNMELPIANLHVDTSAVQNRAPLLSTGAIGTNVSAASRTLRVDDTSNATRRVFAQLTGASAGGVKLTDFYNAEAQDRIIRYMRAVVEENPELGEEQVLRWANGMRVETDRQCFILAERSIVLSQDYTEATDGTALLNDVARSKLMGQVGFEVVVPTTELGGVVVTFITVKPDEVLDDQPHPILSDNWVMNNHIADSLKVDPVSVTMRELDADVPNISETTVAMWTGFNALKRMYVNYGLNRHLNPLTIEDKTALWQYAIPPSVTPENILYPADIPHLPFNDTAAEVARYQIMSTAAINTPIQFGPTPVEELAIDNAGAIFGPGV